MNEHLKKQAQELIINNLEDVTGIINKAYKLQLDNDYSGNSETKNIFGKNHEDFGMAGFNALCAINDPFDINSGAPTDYETFNVDNYEELKELVDENINEKDGIWIYQIKSPLMKLLTKYFNQFGLDFTKITEAITDSNFEPETTHYFILSNHKLDINELNNPKSETSNILNRTLLNGYDANTCDDLHLQNKVLNQFVNFLAKELSN